MTVKNITSFEGIKTDTGDKEVEHFMNVVCNGSTMEPLDSQYRVENRPVSKFGDQLLTLEDCAEVQDVKYCVCPTPMHECLKGYSVTGGSMSGGDVDMYSQWVNMQGSYSSQVARDYRRSHAAWVTGSATSFEDSKGLRTFPFHFNNGSCCGIHHKLTHMKTIETPSYLLSFYVTARFNSGEGLPDNVIWTKIQTGIDQTPAGEKYPVKVAVSPCFFVRCMFKDSDKLYDNGTNADTETMYAEWFAFPISWDYCNNEIGKHARTDYRNMQGVDTSNCEEVLSTVIGDWYDYCLPNYNFSACECNSVDVPFCYISIGPILAWIGMTSYGTKNGDTPHAISGTIPDPEFTPKGGPSSISVYPIGTSSKWYELEETPVVTAFMNSPCWRRNFIPDEIGDNEYYDPSHATAEHGWTFISYLSEINHSEASRLNIQTRYVKYIESGTVYQVGFPARSVYYQSYSIPATRTFHNRNWSLTFFNQRLFALDKNTGTVFATNAGIESAFTDEMYDFTQLTSVIGTPFTSKAEALGYLSSLNLYNWFDMDTDGVYQDKIWGWYGKPSSSSGLAKQIYSSDNTLYLVFDSSVDTYALSNLSDQPITMTYQNTHSPNGVFSHIFHDGSVALLFENCGLGIKVYKFNEDGSLALVSNAEMEKRLYRHCKNLLCTTYLSNGKRFVAILADDKSYAYLYDVNGGYWTEMNLFSGKNFVSFYLNRKYPVTIPIKEYEDNDGEWNDDHIGEADYRILNTKFFVGRKHVPSFTCLFEESAIYTDHTACGTAGLLGESGYTNPIVVTMAPSFYGSRKALTYVQVVGDNKNEDSTKTASSTTWSLSVSFDNGKTFNTAKTRIKGSEQRMDKDIEWRALGSGNNSAIKITAEGVKEDSQIYAINTEVK